MFDFGQEDSKLQEIKYNYIVLPELPERELLKNEKEMLGIYITGHPLEKIRDTIERNTNINNLIINKMVEENDFSKDNSFVKYAGIITQVKKKYTKNNTIMAFVTVEDLYGTCEIIVFDSCYSKCSNILLVDNIVLIDGKLSVREDEDAKIVARDITELKEKHSKNLEIDITNLDDEQKNKLRGILRFFNGEKNNIAVYIIDGNETESAGSIYITDEIIKEFKEIIGDNIELR